ncbi:hypothetical protein BVRB_041770 [Beta vulgaris subsp. vulgaris]|uniref:Uncharacterized protein n=1 Tax=Beta vulgaris subsp. vulgaris TaxID=3555 RepID=A0A0J8BGG7_BETVV|nr:hypothetical protein BVRB_041770 [Beta vulgaris subsp. vulgaris]
MIAIEHAANAADNHMFDEDQYATDLGHGLNRIPGHLSVLLPGSAQFLELLN